jgi:hypothetical protein
MAYIFPSTTLVERLNLAVGISAFLVHVSSTPELIEVTTNITATTITLLVFIFFIFDILPGLRYNYCILSPSGQTNRLEQVPGW